MIKTILIFITIILILTLYSCLQDKEITVVINPFDSTAIIDFSQTPALSSNTFVFSCGTTELAENFRKEMDSMVKNQKQITLAKNTISKKLKFLENTRWTAGGDTSNYMVDITFHDEYLLYWYHGQCIYSYFTYSYKDSVKLIWSYKTDCLLNMDMLERSYGFKKYPTHGAIFSSYKLVNDSIIKVTYYFPEWTKKVNQAAKDTIFPNYFRKYE